MSVGLLWGIMLRSAREQSLQRRIPKRVIIVQNIDLFMRLLAKPVSAIAFSKILSKTVEAIHTVLAYRNWPRGSLANEQKAFEEVRLPTVVIGDDTANFG